MTFREDFQGICCAVYDGYRAKARPKCVCTEAGVISGALRRWMRGPAWDLGESRSYTVRLASTLAPTKVEIGEVLRVTTELRAIECPLVCIVSMLVENAHYVASNSSFSQMLRCYGQTRRRVCAGASHRLRPRNRRVSLQPQRLLCSEGTCSLIAVLARWFHLHLIPVPCSGKSVGYEAAGDLEHGVILLGRMAPVEDLYMLQYKLEVHRDDGKPGKRSARFRY